MRMETQADRVIAKFGGIRPMAEKLSTPDTPVAHTTVQRWKETGFIPAKRQPFVLEKAREHGIPLTPADFFPPDPPEPQPPATAAPTPARPEAEAA